MLSVPSHMSSAINSQREEWRKLFPNNPMGSASSSVDFVKRFLYIIVNNIVFSKKILQNDAFDMYKLEDLIIPVFNEKYSSSPLYRRLLNQIIVANQYIDKQMLQRFTIVLFDIDTKVLDELFSFQLNYSSKIQLSTNNEDINMKVSFDTIEESTISFFKAFFSLLSKIESKQNKQGMKFHLNTVNAPSNFIPMGFKESQNEFTHKNTVSITAICTPHNNIDVKAYWKYSDLISARVDETLESPNILGVNETHNSSIIRNVESHNSPVVENVDENFDSSVNRNVDSHNTSIINDKYRISPIIGNVESHNSPIIGNDEFHNSPIIENVDGFHDSSVIGNVYSHNTSIVENVESHNSSIIGNDESHNSPIMGNDKSHNSCIIENVDEHFESSVIGNVKSHNSTNIKNVDENVDSSIIGNVDFHTTSIIGNDEYHNSPIIGSDKHRISPIIGIVESHNSPIIENDKSHKSPVIGNVKSRNSTIIKNVDENVDSSVVGNVDFHNTSNIGNDEYQDSPIIGNIEYHNSPIIECFDKTFSLPSIGKNYLIQPKFDKIKSNIESMDVDSPSKLQSEQDELMEVMNECIEICCPCGREFKDVTFLMCINCKNFQHSICYGLLKSQSTQHICGECDLKDDQPSVENSFANLQYHEKQDLCLIRHALVLCMESNSMDSSKLKESLGISKSDAHRLLRIMKKNRLFHVSPNDYEDLSQSFEINKKHLKIAMKKYFKTSETPTGFIINNMSSDTSQINPDDFIAPEIKKSSNTKQTCEKDPKPISAYLSSLSSQNRSDDFIIPEIKKSPNWKRNFKMNLKPIRKFSSSQTCLSSSSSQHDSFYLFKESKNTDKHKNRAAFKRTQK